MHNPSAWEAMPAISTLRVDNSMKNKIRKRCSPRPVQASTLKKSAATISSQCCVRNSFQVVFRSRKVQILERAETRMVKKLDLLESNLMIAI